MQQVQVADRTDRHHGRSHSSALHVRDVDQPRPALEADHASTLCGAEPLLAEAVNRREKGPGHLVEPNLAVEHQRHGDSLVGR